MTIRSQRHSRDYDRLNDRDRKVLDFSRLVARWLIGVAVAAFVMTFAWQAAMPQFRLYRANTEKKAAIAEAKATEESAQYLADAEIERARGVSEANKIIAASITAEYIQWLYVDQMDRLQGQVIYIPTEGGIPLLEAGRSVERSTDD